MDWRETIKDPYSFIEDLDYRLAGCLTDIEAMDPEQAFKLRAVKDLLVSIRAWMLNYGKIHEATTDISRPVETGTNS